MSLHHKAFALLYDPLNSIGERTWMGRAREQLVGPATGQILEIGAGTGANLSHYEQAERVVLTEPDVEMRERLRSKLGQASVPVEVSPDSADHLDFPDASFDVVVSTLVLCTVPDPAATVAEARRVLRPGGKLLFIEHVRGDDSRRLKVKRFVEPLWSWVALGCRITQDTVGLLEQAGFAVDVTEVMEPSKVPPVVKPFLMGVATR